MKKGGFKPSFFSKDIYMNNFEKIFSLLKEETEAKSKTSKERLKEYLKQYLYNKKEEELLARITRIGKTNFLKEFYKGDGRNQFSLVLDELKRENVLPANEIENFKNKYNAIPRTRTSQVSEGYGKFLDFLQKSSLNPDILYDKARINSLAQEFNLYREQVKRGLEKFFSKEEIEKVKKLQPKLHNTSINENTFYNKVKNILEESYPDKYVLEKNKILGRIGNRNADADLYLEVPGKKIAVLWDGSFHLKPFRDKDIKSIDQFIKTNKFALKKLELFDNLGIKVIVVEDPKGYIKTKNDDLSLPKITASKFIFNLKNSSAISNLFVNKDYIEKVKRRINDQEKIKKEIEEKNK